MNLKDFNPDNFTHAMWYRFRGIVTCDGIRKTFYPLSVERTEKGIDFKFEFEFDFKVLMKTFEIHKERSSPRLQSTEPTRNFRFTTH